MKKAPFKSKTINSVLVIVVIAMMSFFGFGEAEIVEAQDAIGTSTENKVPIETIKQIVTVVAAGVAIYGRYTAKESK